MRRSSFLALTFVLLAAAAPAEARAGGAGLYAFVAAEDDDRLVVVDVEARQVLRRIPVAAGPHNVAASADGRYVVVTSPPSGRVTLVSARTFRVL